MIHFSEMRQNKLSFYENNLDYISKEGVRDTNLSNQLSTICFFPSDSDYEEHNK